MFERKLFLGYLIDACYEKHLSKANPQLLSLFTSPNGEYLHQLLHQDQNYLGRFLPSPHSLSDIELLKPHIFSLLKRLAPDYTYENSQLWLFPVVNVTIIENAKGVFLGRN